LRRRRDSCLDIEVADERYFEGTLRELWREPCLYLVEIARHHYFLCRHAKARIAPG